eukprot:gene11254-12557_t
MKSKCCCSLLVILVIVLILVSSSTIADSSSSLLLRGRVACVTGASRGIGRGVAIALAECGATVYITGRSLNPKVTTEKDLGGSLQEVVEEVEAAVCSGSGRAIPIAVDHRDDQQVRQLFEKITKEQGRLDILVNNAFQLPSPSSSTAAAVVEEEEDPMLFKPFWQQSADQQVWDSVMTVGLRSHYVSSYYAFPLLQQTTSNSTTRSRPLIVHISSFGGATYSFNLAYGVGKAGVDRLAKDMAHELNQHCLPIDCIALYPGIVRTERMDTLLQSGEFEMRTGLATPSQFVESPYLSGEVIAALYQDLSYRQKMNGQVLVTAELAKRYDIHDRLSGITPPSIRSLKYLLPAMLLTGKDEHYRKQWQDWIIRCSPDVLLPWSIMSNPPPRTKV